jgi:hypothetical protein
LPIHQRRGAPDHLDAALILQTAQAEFDRIEPGRGRKLVGEALDRETIGRLARRADRRRTQRRIFEPMDQHLNVVRGIGRIGILRDQSRLRTAHIVEPGCCRRQQRNIRQSPRRLRQPHFGAPGENAPTRVNRTG